MSADYWPPTPMAPSGSSGAHVFEVTDYSRHRILDAGGFVRSATFDVGGYTWSIRFHPGGDALDTDSRDYAAVTLCLMTKDAVVVVLYDMALIDQTTGARWFGTKSDKAVFDTCSAGRFWRWPLSRFKKRSELEASPYLRDDRLAIECTLTVISGILEADVPTVPLINGPLSDLRMHLSWMQEKADGHGGNFLAHRIAKWLPLVKAQIESQMKDGRSGGTTVSSMQSVFRAILNRLDTMDKLFHDAEAHQSGTQPDGNGNGDDAPVIGEKSSSTTPEEYTGHDRSIKITGATVAERVKQNGRKRKMPSNLSLMVLPKKRKAALVSAGQVLEMPGRVDKFDDPLECNFRENVAIQYIQSLCSSKESDGKVVFKSHHGSVVANAMRCLTIPSTVDEPCKNVSFNIVNAYTAHTKPQTQLNRLLCPVWYGSMLADKLTVDKCFKPENLGFYQSFARNFFCYDLVFFPLVVTSGAFQHWIVVVMCTTKMEFQILDSSWDLQRYQSTVQSLIEGIARLTSAARIAYPNLPEDVATWKIKMIKNVPKQIDGCSCGLYIIKYMQCWDGTKMRPYFTQEDIHLFRKKIVAELIFSESNEAEEAKEEVRRIMKLQVGGI